MYGAKAAFWARTSRTSRASAGFHRLSKLSGNRVCEPNRAPRPRRGGAIVTGNRLAHARRARDSRSRRVQSPFDPACRVSMEVSFHIEE